MAHLVNAKAMRIGWEQDWCDVWYSSAIIIVIIYILVFESDIF